MKYCINSFLFSLMFSCSVTYECINNENFHPGLESSVKEMKFEDLKNFEILGCLLNDSQTLMDGKRYAPSLSRTNKESGVSVIIRFSE